MFTQLSKVCESFSSKVMEWMADHAVTNLKDIMDFKPILETLVNNLKSLSAQAYDVEHQIKNAELSGRKKRKLEVKEWLEEVESIQTQVGELVSGAESQGFITRLMEGGTAAKLNVQVEKLVEQSRNFGELVLSETRGETLLTDELVGEAFNENLETIMKHLESREVSSIGVYGMGGAGKSTLVKHIHNRLLQQSQGRVFWVTVSQEFTIKSLQDKIARLLDVDLSDEDEQVIRAARLHRALSHRNNSVLILDDVWQKIDMSKVGCLFSVDSCKLIITTRSLEVCHQICCQKLIRVEQLGENEAWKLFIVTLGKEIQLGRQVEEIAKSMAKMCDGLPLGIITVAGSMRGETAIHMWKNALEELKECVRGQDGMHEVDEVFKVLKYSFDRLNTNRHSNEFDKYQLCFLYCSLYPEDEKIRRMELVKRFISEGLLEERKSRRAQVDYGLSILDKLVKVCILESCENSFSEECVKMHDLVRGMALKICEGKYMVRAGEKSLGEITDEEEWTKNLEKVSFMDSGITRVGDGMSPNCPKLSTLILYWSFMEVIPDSFFSKLQGLCTLDLCHTRIIVLLDSICDMKCLKALLLEHCGRLEYVPNLGGLKALRELNLSQTAIKEVPEGVEGLLKLKFLSIDAPNLEMIPSGLLLKLIHLQHVELPFHVQVSKEEIEKLKQVEVFRGAVKKLNDFNWLMRSQVYDSYAIGTGLNDATGDRIGNRFTAYKNELILSGCNLKEERVLGQGVVYLTIRECEGLSICFSDDFARLNNPTSLEILHIMSCRGVECIWRSKHGLPSQISNTLKNIELVELEDLKGLIEKGEVVAPSAALTQPLFSRLTVIIIKKCNKMRKVGLLAMGVPNLQYIEISKCGEIEEIFEDEGRDSLSLPYLGMLILLELPKLKSVCKSTLIINSKIHIKKCPGLTKLPMHVDDPPPPNLRQIRVERGWWESLEWDNPKLPQLLQSSVKFY